jgi:hypothetical protein
MVMMHIMWRDVDTFSPELDQIMEDMAIAENGMLRVPINLPGFAFFKAMKVYYSSTNVLGFEV